MCWLLRETSERARSRLRVWHIAFNRTDQRKGCVVYALGGVFQYGICRAKALLLIKHTYIWLSFVLFETWLSERSHRVTSWHGMVWLENVLHGKHGYFFFLCTVSILSCYFGFCVFHLYVSFGACGMWIQQNWKNLNFDNMRITSIGAVTYSKFTNYMMSLWYATIFVDLLFVFLNFLSLISKLRHFMSSFSRKRKADAIQTIVKMYDTKFAMTSYHDRNNFHRRPIFNRLFLVQTYFNHPNWFEKFHFSFRWYIPKGKTWLFIWNFLNIVCSFFIRSK